MRPMLCKNVFRTDSLSLDELSETAFVLAMEKPKDADIEALEKAREIVRLFGVRAEHEVNLRAELAILRGDLEDFAMWGRVVVFVSDLNSKR